jgi:hypothetical protein
MTTTGNGKCEVSVAGLKATVEIKAFREGAVMPKKATEGAAGYDLCACIPDFSNGMMIHPGKMLLPSGFNSAFNIVTKIYLIKCWKKFKSICWFTRLVFTRSC